MNILGWQDSQNYEFLSFLQFPSFLPFLSFLLLLEISFLLRYIERVSNLDIKSKIYNLYRLKLINNLLTFISQTIQFISYSSFTLPTSHSCNRLNQLKAERINNNQNSNNIVTFEGNNIFYYQLQGKNNSDVFVEFLKQLLEEIKDNPQLKNWILVMDNSPIHKSKQVQPETLSQVMPRTFKKLIAIEDYINTQQFTQEIRNKFYLIFLTSNNAYFRELLKRFKTYLDQNH
ncbi:hypothetical protein pb186bvf_004330 [Paramecium bursaria]